NFDKFVPGQKFHRLDKIHLNNSVSDPTYMTEILCRELFAAAGVPVARAGHARVELNVRDAGLYVLVEGYNKRFLKQHFRDASGHLYDSEFMHDVAEPLKRSGSPPPSDSGAARALERGSVGALERGSVDRSDLQALAAACEPNAECGMRNSELKAGGP